MQRTGTKKIVLISLGLVLIFFIVGSGILAFNKKNEENKVEVQRRENERQQLEFEKRQKKEEQEDQKEQDQIIDSGKSAIDGIIDKNCDFYATCSDLSLGGTVDGNENKYSAVATLSDSDGLTTLVDCEVELLKDGTVYASIPNSELKRVSYNDEWS